MYPGVELPAWVGTKDSSPPLRPQLPGEGKEIHSDVTAPSQLRTRLHPHLRGCRRMGPHISDCCPSSVGNPVCIATSGCSGCTLVTQPRIKVSCTHTTLVTQDKQHLRSLGGGAGSE